MITDINQSPSTSPDWIKSPTDVRMRHDIPKALRTNAGQKIIPNNQFFNILSSVTLGVAVGAPIGSSIGITSYRNTPSSSWTGFL
jgi:hypothetical protein